MNESSARNTVLLRAFETGPSDERWSEVDRTWADRAAAQISAPAPATTQLSSGDFAARRAGLSTQRLTERDPGIAHLLRSLTWRQWVGPLVIALAFLLGLATDAIGPSKRINLLAPPLLGILIWNLVVYVLMFAVTLWLFARPAGVSPQPIRGPLDRLIAWLAMGWRRKASAVPGPGSSPPAELTGPEAVFARDWIRLSRPLTGARVAGILHWSAAALALGALTALYVRGLGLEYEAGWESTFLGAAGVQRLLQLLFLPATMISGITLPDLATVEAMHFRNHNATGASGNNAAAWIHLYALTLGLFVILPRVVLATYNSVRSHRLQRNFPLAIDSPYFESLARIQRGDSAQLVVIPYSYHPAGTVADALSRVLSRIHGAASSITFLPPIQAGDEDYFQAPHLDQPATVAIALYALTATPELENHGAFIAALRTAMPQATLVMAVVDESGFRKRFGGQPDRLEQRRAAWRKTLAARGHVPVFIDLGDSALNQAENQLRIALQTQSQPPASTLARPLISSTAQAPGPR